MKTEADQPSAQGQPQLPNLPSLPTPEGEPSNSSGDTPVVLTSDPPPEKKRKSALDDLFGDVFITKVRPGKSVLQLVESELANYKVEETMPVNSNPLLWWEANELKYPILSKLAKNISVSLPHQWPVTEFSSLQGTLCLLRGHVCIVTL